MILQYENYYYFSLREDEAFCQRGVRMSFGHPVADFGHPNIHIFVYNAMG